MKKIISIILIMASLMFGSVPALAASKEPATAGVVSPQFIGIALISANISIDSLGCATCTGKVVPSSSTYTSYLTVSLQKYSSGSWTTIKRWTASNTGFSGVNLSGSYYVSSGMYREASTATIYSSSGTLVDSATAYSSTKTY